jgi:hypothetical protein
MRLREVGRLAAGRNVCMAAVDLARCYVSSSETKYSLIGQPSYHAHSEVRHMWTPFNFFVSSWEGTGTGQPGASQVERTYQFVLNGKFLHVKNKSTYPPQDQNPQGEVHEDWGFIEGAPEDRRL